MYLPKQSNGICYLCICTIYRTPTSSVQILKHLILKRSIEKFMKNLSMVGVKSSSIRDKLSIHPSYHQDLYRSATQSQQPERRHAQPSSSNIPASRKSSSICSSISISTQVIEYDATRSWIITRACAVKWSMVSFQLNDGGDLCENHRQHVPRFAYLAQILGRI